MGINDISVPQYNPQGSFNPVPTALPPLQAQNVPISPVDQFGGIQSPEQGPAPTQMPPELSHINDVLGQYIQTKQDQNPGGLTQSLLQQRFQPTTEDAARSITQTASSFGAPDLFRPITPDQAMAQRYSNEFSPYTSMLQPQMQAAALQGQQIKNQYMPQSEEADIALKKAQAQMATGMFGGMAAGGPGGASGGLHGDQFLQSLPPAFATTVKAIAEGRAPYPSGFALKTPIGQQMVAAISQYDPTFDAINYQARQKTRQSFTSGQDAGNITALNTAMAHLGTLSGNYDKLGNTNFPAVNWATNYLGNQFGNQNIQTNTANVATDAQAVAHELAKVFRSTGMSEGEINQWQDKISTSAGPAQSKAVIQSALDLIDGRLSALGEKYNQGMGTSKQGIELLSPEAQAAYSKLRGTGAPAQNNQQTNQPAQAGSKTINFSDLPP